MKYRREIDGLRALAVFPVVLFHAGFKAFEGGFVGVDVFFVLSGYLITSIIFEDMDKENFSIIKFYERRARRILPALFFVILCCLPFAWLWLLPIHLKDFSQSLVAVSTFSSNILFWKETGYFGVEAELKPLLHTWSLSLEEQYYLLFPPFLMALFKLRKQWMWGILTMIAIVSLIVAQWGAYNVPSGAFYFLPARGWELAIGALIAFYFSYKRTKIDTILSCKITSELLGLLGLLLICYSVIKFDKFTPFPSLYTLIPTLGTALIIVFSTPSNIVGRLLGAKPMVGIGLISYSIYLWHQPLFAFARHRSLTEPSAAFLIILSFLSVGLAYFSWRFVETPFRNKQIISSKKVFSFAGVGSVLFAMIGLTGHISNGYNNRLNNNGILLADISKKVIINYGLNQDCIHKFTLSPNCRTSDEPEILVWGDSYAMHLIQGILASNPSAKIIQMTKSACGPFFEVAPISTRYPASSAKECLSFNSSIHTWLKTHKTIKYVVLSSPFGQYLEASQVIINDHLYEANQELVTKQFIATINQLKNLGLVPIVFSPTPQNGENIGECLAKAQFYSEDLNACNFRREAVNKTSDEVFQFLKNISKNSKVIFMDEGICEEGLCKVSSDYTFIYRDSGHLSHEGSALLGKKMNFYSLIVGNKRSSW